MSQTLVRYALRYPPENIFHGGKFVALDRSSGGYPYPTAYFHDVQLFATEEEASKYRDMFNKINFEIDEVSITFTGINEGVPLK